MIKAVLFDLDGTLLQMDDKEFLDVYFKLLYNKFNISDDYDLFVKNLMKAVKKMYINDGLKTNGECFWDEFNLYYNEIDKTNLNHFYLNEFKVIEKINHKNIYAKLIIEYLRENNISPILATNPLFPINATVTRLDLLDLTIDDFDFISTFDNFNCSKPNIKYYTKLLERLNLEPGEVLLFGNNEYEDGIASTIGIKTFIVSDFLIKDKEERFKLPHVLMKDVLDTIIKEIERN